MSDLRTVALEVVEQSRALVDEIDEFQSPSHLAGRSMPCKTG